MKHTKLKPVVAKLPPASQITCPNPKCGRPHALKWHVGATGKKRQLVYYCDRVERQSKCKHLGNAIIVMTTQRCVAPENVVPTADVPEDYTTPAADKLNEARQYQLSLMR